MRCGTMHDFQPSFLMFAQDGPPLPGAGNGTTAVPPAGPAPTGGTPGGPAPSPGSNPMLLIILMVAGLLLFTMWSSRRDRKKREAIINAIKKHDRVRSAQGRAFLLRFLSLRASCGRAVNTTW